MNYNKRSEIEEKYKWDLTYLYKSDNSCEKEFKNTKEEIKDITKFEGSVMKSEKKLHDTLDLYYELNTKLSNLFMYASLKHDEDLSNSDYSLLYNKIYSLYCDFISLSSFIMPEVLKAPKSTLTNYLKSKDLEKYKFLLEDAKRYKKHTLTSNEEKIISKLSVSSAAFDKLSSTLINSTLSYGELIVDGEKTVLTNSNYRNIMMNKNRDTRKECYRLMTAKLKEFIDIFGESLIANMKQVSSLAQIKNYPSTIEMQLFNSNIPKEVVENLYKTVHSRLDVFQKYLRFLKSNLGLDKLEYYDLNAEYINKNLSFTVEDAESLIEEATKIYGDEYNKIIKKAFAEKWIDYGSYKGKRSGAYCTASYGKHPVILTNFHHKFTDVSAVAHELGHAVNFSLSMQNNNAHDYENDIFVAEVASLTNEIILSNYIFTHSNNKNLKLTAIANLIDIIQNNLFDACLEGELENEVYTRIDNKEEIDGNFLSEYMYNERKEYYGKEVIIDDNVKYLWARRAHYYSPFYLYQYATGVSSAIAIATKIINGDEKTKKKYIDFLGKGSTDYPINLLKEMGFDLTKPEVINNAIDYFDYLINLYSKVSDE